MSDRVTIKLPKWEHRLIKLIAKEWYNGATIPETIENLLAIFGAQCLVARKEGVEYMGLGPLEDGEPYLEEVKDYWAKMGHPRQKERVIREEIRKSVEEDEK